MALREHTKTNPKLLMALGVVAIVVLGYVLWSLSQGGSGTFFSVEEEVEKEEVGLATFDVNTWVRPELEELVGEVGGELAVQVKGVATDPNVPLAPEEINAFDPKTGRLINVFWLAPLGGTVKTYRVYRSENEGVIGNIVGDNVTVFHFQDRDVRNGVAYYYLVRSVTPDGKESKNTNQVVATPSDTQAPASPTNLTVKDAGEGGVLVIGWSNPPDSDFVGVNIYRSEVEGALGARIQNLLSNTTTFRDSDVRDGQALYYTVTAVDGEGNESSVSLGRVASGRLNPFIPSAGGNE